jgi:hypothetical protein
MLEQATAIHEDDEPGRWRIDTTRDRQPWEVVVEPQLDERVLLVITAYRVESL